MRSAQDLQAVRRLIHDGLSEREISRRTGVPRQTVGAWRRGDVRRNEQPWLPGRWRPGDPAVYAYLLGLYLGDGHLVVRSARSAFVRLTLDAAYPGVVDEAAAALETVVGCRRVRRYTYGPARRVIVQASAPYLPDVFPQHGPGKKHSRAIQLRPWQRAATVRWPRNFLRGLLHSDGCRSVNRFSVELAGGQVAHYAYPRYFFSNLSGDIRGLFCEHCDQLGIEWTCAGRNVTISKRLGVAALDDFVGPKR